ncbi:MAG: transglutaminase-like superfamily protein [Proteobacteria bacterium]|nr:transglutaminase-like superfamily protein [Pseudomonadota bacterium]
MKPYLQSCAIIDFDHADVAHKAAALAAGCISGEQVAEKCFVFVRDEIRHSRDFNLNPLTCKASEVLQHKTGYCYAKSHLLAALLRANGIPAGLCYQRLSVGTGGPPYCLHGLNAIYLKGHGWYRVDARGNKPGVEAVFCPPVERLAFPIVEVAEADLPEIWAEPLPLVVRALESGQTVEALYDHLPDIELVSLAARKN